MQPDGTQDDPQARIEADDIIYWAERLHVTPEELRSAVQKGGTMVRDVIAELERRRPRVDEP
jgi:hypothetical protein